MVAVDGACRDLAPGADLAEADFARVLAVNLTGVFLGMKYQIPHLLETGGAIVNTASIWSEQGAAAQGAYVASKHALVGLTKVAALEYTARGVRTNAVGPGFIDTPLVRSSLSSDALSALEKEHAAGRLGTDAEVAALVLFLLSPEASFISGSYHLVDGGYSAH